ncbi:exo-alpha-sialidase, partial [bacterium]|nr:exo-alpha-sialidase [bacterium]
MTFDLEGNLYYGHLSDPVTGYWIDRIVVQKSTDGGESWNHGAGVGFFYPKNQDKEWLIADLTDSQYSNNIYMAWTEFDGYASTYPQDSSRVRFSRSTDFGETWSTSLRVSDVGGDCLDGDNTVEGAVPAVGPDGEVYLSWAGPLGIMFDKSMDGGVTFGKDIFVTSQPGGWNFFVMGLQRCNGFPVTICDISDSPYRGTIYILFSDQRNGTMDTDVFLVKSLDRGETWSSPKRVNDDDSGKHQFFPWMAVDPFTGYIYIVFYDRRETIGEDTDVYMATSYDGGETFDNFKISEFPFRSVHSVFLGDYINITAWNGMVYPIWVRIDYYDRSVWCA